MKQKDTFLACEGDNWYRRNVASNHARVGEYYVNPLKACCIIPSRVLEIGCSSAAVLDSLSSEFRCKCAGIDPSAEAIAEGRRRSPHHDLRVGTADALPFEDAGFNLVLFGFCLYLCDPQLLFRIASEADRVLATGGYLQIVDFSPPIPYRNPYAHSPGLYSHKMEFFRLFEAYPSYHLLHHHVHHGQTDPDERIATSILKKDLQNAFIQNPFVNSGSP